jgi:NTP pyrophosphatase (non-canonical NTP hydrolase)
MRLEFDVETIEALATGETNNLNQLSKAIFEHNLRAGWWSNEDLANLECRTVGGKYNKETITLVTAKLMLVVTEIAEAVEGLRKGLMDDHLPHRSMLEVEIADAQIRLADISGFLGLDVGGALIEKRAYNAKRADHKMENRMAAGGKTI